MLTAPDHGYSDHHVNGAVSIALRDTALQGFCAQRFWLELVHQAHN
jgi:hypothetical protein